MAAPRPRAAPVTQTALLRNFGSVMRIPYGDALQVGQRAQSEAPPQTMICWPVMLAAPSESRNAVVAAISSGLTRRLSGGIFGATDARRGRSEERRVGKECRSRW